MINMIRTIAAVAMVAGMAVGIVQAAPHAYHASVPKPTLSNIPYGSHDRQVLDFWKAPLATAGHPAPLVFYIHGGSWKTGSKEIINGCVDVNALLKAGISVVARPRSNSRFRKESTAFSFCLRTMCIGHTIRS